MKLTGIHHVSILVSDMERSAAWYRDRLGLREVPRPSNFITPVRWFELGEQQLHLIPSPEPDTVSPRHFALHVDDCRGARETLTCRGIAIQETVPIAGAERFFIADPDGNNIEVIQWLRPWDETSEAELGVPDNGQRTMTSERWREERLKVELPQGGVRTR
jgi:catechol 2,3-dioxygenase-like lactoylglutathione lyase family enzyme